MSTEVVVVMGLGVLVVVCFLGGLAASRRRAKRDAPEHHRAVVAANRALARARAADKGWDRSVLEAAANAALALERPGWSCEEIHLVLVEDHAGVDRDRAHLLACGLDRDVRLVLARQGEGWRLDTIE